MSDVIDDFFTSGPTLWQCLLWPTDPCRFFGCAPEVKNDCYTGYLRVTSMQLGEIDLADHDISDDMLSDMLSDHVVRDNGMHMMQNDVRRSKSSCFNASLAYFPHLQYLMADAFDRSWLQMHSKSLDTLIIDGHPAIALQLPFLGEQSNLGRKLDISDADSGLQLPFLKRIDFSDGEWDSDTPTKSAPTVNWAKEKAFSVGFPTLIDFAQNGHLPVAAAFLCRVPNVMFLRIQRASVASLNHPCLGTLSKLQWFDFREHALRGNMPLNATIFSSFTNLKVLIAFGAGLSPLPRPWDRKCRVVYDKIVDSTPEAMLTDPEAVVEDFDMFL
jgi:hypothetical protein